MSITFGRGTLAVAGAVAVMAALAIFAAAPAQAHSNTLAACNVTFPAVSITPAYRPLVLSPGTGTVSSGGQTGTVRCLGEIGGDRVTGPGAAGIVYAYSNGTCIAHVGSGIATWSIPTEAGLKQLTGTLSVRRIGLGVLAEVRFPDARADLVGALVPLEGDCVLTPLSKVLVTVAGPLAET